MHSRLEKIIEEKKREVESLQEKGLPSCSISTSGISNGIIKKDFKAAISRAGSINLIAEIKFASPSAGAIRNLSDPLRIGRIYERAGASAISLLTDKPFFKGDIQNLPLVKKGVSIPVLRKDFIIHEIQVKESALMGADAVLLIARILPDDKLKALYQASVKAGLAVLMEIHDQEDLEKALECDAEIIGINNRNLDTFEIDMKTTMQLAPMIPSDCIVVDESGIHTAHDITELKGKNINAVLVGSSIMSSDDIEAKVMELVAAGKK